MSYKNWSTEFMSNLLKKTLIVIVLIGLVTTATLFSIRPSSSNLNAEDKEVLLSASSKPTIATAWQWHHTDKEDKIKTTSNVALPFTVESVYTALQAVKLDQDGNIILDHDALLSLDETLERIHNKLDSQSLGLLQELIRKALPGKAGVQTAKIVADYYQYLQAKDEFGQINEAMADTNNDGTLESIQSDEALYAELQAIREVHIGEEATRRLFRISDSNAQYMFDSMKLESNSNLAPEEREKRRREIAERHRELSINITDWPIRYQAFMKDKRDIISGPFEKQEKRKQLQALLRKHFDEQELKRIAHLGLDQL